jgi:hypothetical protein
MIIWVIFLALAGLLGFTGYRLGAVRMAISILGLLLAAVIWVKAGPMLEGVFAKTADGNPLILYVAPILVVFAAIYFAFSSISYVVGEKIYVYYKWKVPDDIRVMWETMNRRVGAALGVVSGVAHFVVLGLLVYTLGYWTMQLPGEAGETSSGPKNINEIRYSSTDKPKEKTPGGAGGIKMLAKIASPLRASLSSSGLERLIAAFDPAPDNFYHLADCVGLVYHNPTAARRFLSYPGTLALAETAPFQSMLRDTNFHATWESKPGPRSLLLTEQSRSIFKDPALIKQIMEVDAKDAYEYLQTGKTEKYKDEPLLGRWDIHLQSTVVKVGENHPNITADISNLALLRRYMVQLIRDVSLLATPDNRLMVKGALEDQRPLVDMVNGRAPSARTNSPYAKVLISGTWKKEGNKYSATFGDQGAKGETMVISGNNSLTVSFFGGTLVFSKAD